MKYATQGGGVVIYDATWKCYVFVEAPEWVGCPYRPGDFMPEEWGLIRLT